MEDNPKHKSFKAKRAGRKAEKKEVQDKKKRGLSTDKKNVKAFQKKPMKDLRRRLDMQERKLHVPIQNRTYGEPPPTVVAIVGPPKSGKTTLIKSLLKHYTKRKVNEVKGPITVRGGKNRFTFMECDNDMNSYIDTAKVADVVLLLINAQVGFEMESFEFINILQNHGFTKVMGVLTHLDAFKDNKKVKDIKKKMKHRFWSEVVEGSKVFYLSGIRSDLYTPREMVNLGRFLSLIKPRPLTWRTTHPAILVDRVEDTTNPEVIKKNPKVDRSVCLYGYVRGTFLKQKMNVHIPGVGDFQIHASSSLEDPLPKILKDKRSINDKYRGIYGPMSNMGDLFYDKDSIYLNVVEQKKGEEEAQLLDGLQGSENTLDGLIQTQKFKIFKSNDDEEEEEEIQEEEDEIPEDDEEEDEEEEEGRKEKIEEEEEGENPLDQFSKFIDKTRRRANFDQMVQPEKKNVQERIEFEDDEDDEEETEDLTKVEKVEEPKFQDLGSSSDQWKEKINEKTNQLFYSRTLSLFELVYGSELNPIKIQYNDEDLTRHFLPKDELLDWDDEEIQDSIRNKFVTGDWKQRRSKKEEKKENMETEDNKEELDDYAGGFEDVEGKEETEEIQEEVEEQEEEEEEEDGNTREDYDKKRKEKKKRFDASYDSKDGEEVEEKAPTTILELQRRMEVKDPQVILNKTEFDGMEKAQRELYEGYSPGTYVRLEFKNFPYQFIENLDFTKPLIVGGLHPEELRMGFINMRLKKHRWFPKILKNKDPLIFSIGWRRFQSIPIYSMQDPNLRHRMIKYTPQHMHCIATIYGPMVPQNTGIIAIQNLSSTLHTFRISANGYTMEFDQNISIVKKLKLIGYPKEIKKHTVFVTGMFNSSLEVAKFEGAQLRTVSGLRGQVKKAVKGGREGEFRATFEDKLLKSDIIFLRAWVPIEGVKFYNPVTNLLTKNWVAMRTTNQIRKVKGIEFKVPESNDYQDVERRSKTGHEIEMRIPKNLKKALPFEDQEKEVVQVQGLTQKFLTKDAPVTKLTEALLSSSEKKRANIITKMKAIEAFRNKQQIIKENKQKLEDTRKKLREEKVIDKKVKKNLKRRYILQTEKRVKKAKYHVE